MYTHTLTVDYPIGGNSHLTGQTRQALRTDLYRLLGRRILDTVRQDFIPNDAQKADFSNGSYRLTLTPNTQVGIEHVRTLVEELLIFHPGSSLKP